MTTGNSKYNLSVDWIDVEELTVLHQLDVIEQQIPDIDASNGDGYIRVYIRGNTEAGEDGGSSSQIHVEVSDFPAEIPQSSDDNGVSPDLINAQIHADFLERFAAPTSQLVLTAADQPPIVTSRGQVDTAEQRPFSTTRKQVKKGKGRRYKVSNPQTVQNSLTHQPTKRHMLKEPKSSPLIYQNEDSPKSSKIEFRSFGSKSHLDNEPSEHLYVQQRKSTKESQKPPKNDSSDVTYDPTGVFKIPKIPVERRKKTHSEEKEKEVAGHERTKSGSSITSASLRLRKNMPNLKDPDTDEDQEEEKRIEKRMRYNLRSRD